MKTEPTIWWVNVYDHEAVPYREGIPRPNGYREFVPKADYDALRARLDELTSGGGAESPVDRQGSQEAVWLEPKPITRTPGV